MKNNWKWIKWPKRTNQPKMNNWLKQLKTTENNQEQPKTTENDHELAKTTDQRKTIKNNRKWPKKTENDQPTEKRKKTEMTNNWRWHAYTQKGTGYLCPSG